MIAVVSLDALSLPRTERLLAVGRLPPRAALRVPSPMEAMVDADGIELLHGAVFFTLPTGRRPAATGRFYPFVWDPDAQAVQPDLRHSDARFSMSTALKIAPPCMAVTSVLRRSSMFSVCSTRRTK